VNRCWLPADGVAGIQLRVIEPRLGADQLQQHERRDITERPSHGTVRAGFRHTARQGAGLHRARRHPGEKTISLLAISVSHLENRWKLQLELPLGLRDEKRRPGTRRGMARWTADRAIDAIRERFGWDAVGYGSAMLGLSRSVPDEFRELAEKDL